ncbi:MAG TPA: SIS domain-containing protein [Vicinamibacterales bacterium]|nr:SIS domain-containing protein [Vicinamibacterales bacterium]
MAFEAYLAAAHGALDRVAREQGDSIRRAGAAVADALASGGILHIFGAGHSHLLAEEGFYRAGGLAAINPILDRRLMFFDGALASTRAEREPGYAAEILEREDVRRGDAGIVVSNSGRNAVPLEMAMALHARGVSVIAITSLEHSRAMASRHSSGRKLYEIADVVIDTSIPAGDAAVALPGTSIRMGPLSTVVGATIIHSVCIEAAARLLDRGVAPPVLASANLDTTSQADLERTLAVYADRVRYLDVPRNDRGER